MSKTVDYRKHILDFHQPSGTSRGVLRQKNSYLVGLSENGITGIGECSLIKGLSPDDEEQMVDILQGLKLGLLSPETIAPQLSCFPALQFGLEMAQRDLDNQGKGVYYASPLTKGEQTISINGLVWMGTKDVMLKQIEEKIKLGYTCIKLKIGAINWQDELGLLKHIRANFSSNEIEIRVDANGAFSANGALDKLKTLSEYDLHSIEQPIKQGQWNEMAKLCEQSPLDIALDEELISVVGRQERMKLLNTIQPQYIILKPSLLGGFKSSEEWIELANSLDINWWATSALESNVGLNAIAQWVATKENKRPQGLGTGQLFSNNFPSPLRISEGHLNYDPAMTWHDNLKDFISDDV